MKDIKKKIKILVVDDEPLIRKSLYEILRIEGYRVQMAESAEKALEILKKDPQDIVVTDLKLPNMGGISLLKEARGAGSDAEFIVITGYGSVESAVDAMKQGAFDYITKPINDNEIKIVIHRIVEKRQILNENLELKEMIERGGRFSLCNMVGGSPKMRNIYNIIESVASTNATILISGDSGTGKGLVARAIHQMDQNRKDKPFVEISCGALTETLLESELFGHMKGSFTGAIKDKEGRFEYAKKGTIFLDEIDTFPKSLQVKLLRVLQDGVFERVGDNVARQADTRIIVATNQDLPGLVKKNEFREDLYYRINVINIQMPPLKERREDIDLLLKHFCDKFAKNNNKKIKGFSPDVKTVFQNYDWPGNIRELENAVEGAVIMAKGEIVTKGDIPNFHKFDHSFKTVNSDETTLKKAVEEPEKEHIVSVLVQYNWNRNKAAEALGINRTTLYNKMKKYNIFEQETGGEVDAAKRAKYSD